MNATATYSVRNLYGEFLGRLFPTAPLQFRAPAYAVRVASAAVAHDLARRHGGIVCTAPVWNRVERRYESTDYTSIGEVELTVGWSE